MWSVEKECFVDPKGNPTVDPDKVDFEALVAVIPTTGVWCKGLEEIPNYRQKVDEGIKKKLVDEVKKVALNAEEAVAEEQQVLEEDQIQKVKEAKVPKTEVLIQTESSEMLNKTDHKTTLQEIGNVQSLY
ncbi:hypothetical protein Hanom_Chr17g01567171 [Helianthus anomalus]